MSEGTILHLLGWDKKFVPSFIDFIHKSFSDERHKFIVYGDVDTDVILALPNIVSYRSLLKNGLALSKEMERADKIILHGMFSSHLLYILSLQSWLLKKCHWVIWGGDLYIHTAENKDWRWHKDEFFRRFVIKRIGHLVTYIPGDVDLARQWYGAKGQYHECLMYPSNLYKEYDVPQKEHTTVNIQVGNSADPTNNHLEVFEKLLPHKEQDIKIYVPLSYGDQNYTAKVIETGKQMFGDKFIPLTAFMPFEKYLEFLGQIDIAVFNHKRQQGMGNTITLLGLGKKVYMRNDVTPWTMFSSKGIKLFDVQHIDITPIHDESAQKNITIIKTLFTENILIEQLKTIFRTEVNNAILE